MFSISRCAACGHVFLPNPLNPPASDRLYTDYYPRASYDIRNFKPKTFARGFVSWLNGEASAASYWVPPEVRVLDVGCGFGETLAYHQSRGCDAYGVEMDQNVRKIADHFHFKVQFGTFDSARYSAGFFDYVTLHQVIEHVENPIDTLKRIAEVLRPGGYAVLTTPNANGWGARTFGRRWINWHVPYHRHFFSPDSMKFAAGAAGLTVDAVQTVTSSEWLRYQWIHLLTLPAEGEPSAFWSSVGRRGPSHLVGEKLFEVLHLTRINHMLTRLFDGLGMGDNQLFLLKKP
jgi:SAM-dependent methyltransferase